MSQCKKCGGKVSPLNIPYCRRCGPQSGPRLTALQYEAALVLEMARAQVQTLSWVGEVRRRLFQAIRRMHAC